MVKKVQAFWNGWCLFGDGRKALLYAICWHFVNKLYEILLEGTKIRYLVLSKVEIRNQTNTK